LRDVAQPVGLLALLLASVTVSARIPRLVKVRPDRASHVWMLLGLFAGFGLSSALLLLLGGALPTRSIVVAAFAVILLATFLFPQGRRAGRRLLLGAGCVAALSFAGLHVIDAHGDAPLWPLVLSGAAFLYLWWLGILVFDLSFVWHRYIRHAVVQDKLVEWAPGRPARKAARRKARLGMVADPDLQLPA